MPSDRGAGVDTDRVAPNLAPGPKQWRLELSSFRGISFGATHSYARLDAGGAGPTGGNDFDDFRIERILTAADAEALTANDPTYTWHEGDTIKGFDTEDEARAAALVVWRALAEDGDAVVLHKVHTGEDVMLDGPADVEFIHATRFGYGTTARTLTAVVRRCDSGWEFDQCRMTAGSHPGTQTRIASRHRVDSGRSSTFYAARR